jgi:hypothetical protein
MRMVRVETLVAHRDPATGLWRAIGEVFDMLDARVPERVRRQVVRVCEEQAD